MPGVRSSATDYHRAKHRHAAPRVLRAGRSPSSGRSASPTFAVSEVRFLVVAMIAHRPHLLAPRIKLVAGVTVVAAVAGPLTVAAGWPYWRIHPWWGAIHAVNSAALAAVSALLMMSATTRRCGLLLGLAGMSLPAGWLASWNIGILPFVSEMVAQGIFFLSIGWGIMLYPHHRKLQGILERLWLVAAVLVLIVAQLLIAVVSAPEWNGFAHGVAWPTLVRSRRAFDGLATVTICCQIVLAATFVALLLRRIRYLKGHGPVVLDLCLVLR
jgi:hypothetical protein